MVLYGHLFLCSELRHGINVNICYVRSVCVCVFILVHVCMGRSTGWRDMFYNFGAYVMCSRESVV